MAALLFLSYSGCWKGTTIYKNMSVYEFTLFSITQCVLLIRSQSMKRLFSTDYVAGCSVVNEKTLLSSLPSQSGQSWRLSG